jgi:fatty acid desaturase
MWMELAVVFAIFSFGGIVFGHFEAHTPKVRRIAKQIAFLAISAAIYYTVGRPWSWLWLVIPLAVAVYVHAVWLPRHGINGLTAEPQDKYFALRGWSKSK